MPDVRSIWRYWRQHPPVGWLVAGYLKYKPPAERVGTGSGPARGERGFDTTGNFDDLARLFGSTPGLKLIQGGRADG